MAKGKRSEIPVAPKPSKAKAEPSIDAAPAELPELDPVAIAGAVEVERSRMAAENEAALSGEIDLDQVIPAAELELEPDLVTETLTGDIRDALLAELRSMTVGWQFLTEKHQRAKVAFCEDRARRLVEAVIDQVVGFDWPTVDVVVEDVHIAKNVRIKLSAVIDNGSFAALGRHVMRQAMLVLVTADQMPGERAPVDIIPDQADAFPAGAA
jgi:hypothetical protein